MKSFLQLKFIPLNPSIGLLLLRVWLGGSMIGLHGWSKLQKLLDGDRIGDPIGIGPVPTLILAVFTELILSAFLVLGFLTRFSALMLACTMAIAWAVSHKMALSGPGNGELAFIYLAGFLAILLCGGGKYGIEKS
ncbi:DoxX family protein [Luteolibacter sp. GHJ8]|uniref:DoxX family protein n=1 Tax=Luteolibacter rhizosphaerae TaxID=2989719 RepID=A0ABT3G5V8_9BACT|nr:DoxX family protein [Luteolibacter rhizosphaerae]MCW1915246.1 DoxX family protein [Luteolibacter rhizosphaerae]